MPQISHLIRARCAAGISRLAFGVWLLSSVLITARAVATQAGVFILLGGIQIVATALITFYATRYKDTRCDVHLPRTPETVTEPGALGNDSGAWRPPDRSMAEFAEAQGVVGEASTCQVARKGGRAHDHVTP